MSHVLVHYPAAFLVFESPVSSRDTGVFAWSNCCTMGCGLSSFSRVNNNNNEKVVVKEQDPSHLVIALRSAVLIQSWYRRYRARLEARRRCAWNIYQSLEYEGEQDQVKLYNFFNEMLTHLSPDAVATTQLGSAFNFTPSSEKLDLLQTAPALREHKSEFLLLQSTDPELVSIEADYSGPKIELPINQTQVKNLLEAFKNNQVLHARYLLMLLQETRRRLKKLGNINQATSLIAKQITVIGDLHGKLDDLAIIFYKNGFPGSHNPYIFNGDFVDRGPNSVEVASMLFACFVCNPNEVYLNRGNHEDHVMNLRYGFVKEVMKKYKGDAPKIIQLFTEVFSWLPLATVIDHKILVVHGGVSMATDMDLVERIDRHKFTSTLKPPQVDDELETDPATVIAQRDKAHVDWKQLLDLLWSDPRTQIGSRPNTFRGGGSYFGADVTRTILYRNQLQMLIRSHECKEDGFEYTHNSMVLTIFSASNYYEVGSNRGAYLKMMGPELKRQIVQYMATKQSAKTRRASPSEGLGVVESSAVRQVREKIVSLKTVLLERFQQHDPKRTGLISLHEWCESIMDVTQLELAWITLRPKLARMEGDMVIYNTTFEQMKVESKFSGNGPSVTEMLYKNKENLETIFRLLDKDNSGQISVPEFQEACTILSKHLSLPMGGSDVSDLAKSIDINKDGFIDFNEFLEAFRLVDIRRPSLQSLKSN